MRYVLAEEIHWIERNNRGEERTAKPPVDVVRNVLATPNPPLPILGQITQIPTFSPDGTLHADPGYQETARLCYYPTAGLKIRSIPRSPTAKDVQLALSLLYDDLLVDFPFVDQSDRAHAVALFLLSYVRELILGPTPLHLLESPTPGSGKDLEAEVCLRPAFGPAGLAILAQATDEEEWRRRITSCLRTGAQAILIGNVTTLNSGVLAAALTAGFTTLVDPVLR